ncbi:MAG: type I restriction endonuclease subunit R [Clostridia bacterium]|nr:type I restriction endonuclease subunit R [Clostridia bacterium]
MRDFDQSEKRFEQDIESYLISDRGGYEQFSYVNPDGHRIQKYVYDKERAVYMEVLTNFISKSQPKAWARYVKYYGSDAESKLYRRLQDSINEHGLIYVLKNGIEDMGIKLKLCYFKPESELNEELNEKYRLNVLGVTRQFSYTSKNHNTIDMVLSLNGIPIVALELKNQFMGQYVQNAIRQFKNDRDSKEFCFKLNNRFLVYFAVDLYDVYMTTCLSDGSTYFMPFNQGSNGAGVTGGKGNPVNPDGYSTSYLWEKVLQKDSLLDLINKFISFVTEKEEVEKNGVTRTVEKQKLIFPRYHQFDVVNKVISDVKEYGAGKSYLIEHSAGSGKSNSIAWIAYRLASLHNEDNKPIFDSVIVVTNRVVLDSQLQDTINSFEHKPGLVDAIDDKKRSRGLKDAINDKKRIIICTIQKFLYAYKDFDDLDGRNFAIIIDEAHQGQSGESAKTLRKALIDKNQAIKAYADEEGIEESEVDTTDVLVDTIMTQGKHENQSFFAFTATPKNKTLELFGTVDLSTNKMRPFHVYSMRQAIEEGFILDVLANYTTIKEAFKIVKVSADNPELIEGPALKALVRYYKEHGYTIAQKTEMIMANFLENGRFQINGKGKAMVIADSRANAVRYYLAIKDYLKEHPNEGKDCGVMVAFSGEVEVDGFKYTEAELNLDLDGKPITTDKKFRKEFRSERKNILVVANKYQTGFDEPLLHSMYVDKKLKDVNAVQTLSRLNRTMRDKTSTFVLDFENSDEDIHNSFQPYYETTLLEGRTDFNRVYDLRTNIKPFMLYNGDDVDKYYEFMLTHANARQDEVALGRLASIMKPIVERYLELDTEETKFNARMAIRKFVKAYAYVTQLIRLHDEELFKEYVFATNLLKLLPKAAHPYEAIEYKIKLEYSSLKETFKGAIVLDKKDTDLIPTGDKAKPKVPKKDTLQNIIDKVNERFDGQFNDGDKVIIESIYHMFMNDTEVKKFKRYARDNNPEMFVKSLFPDKFKEIATQCWLSNSDAFTKLFSDSEFYQKVMESMAKELYKTLRKD